MSRSRSREEFETLEDSLLEGISSSSGIFDVKVGTDINTVLSAKAPDFSDMLTVRPKDYGNLYEWASEECRYHNYTILIVYKGIWSGWCKVCISSLY